MMKLTLRQESRRRREIGYLHEIRAYELSLILKDFGTLFRKGSVLEIGSGTGQQLRLLRNNGADVVGVEIESGWYDDHLLEPIIKFDGRVLPFPPGTFDLVFSSNVLEHIESFEEMQLEIARVLKPGGVALHIMPSSTWRTASIVTHYFALPMRVCAWLGLHTSRRQRLAVSLSPRAENTRPLSRRLTGLLFPEKHGVFGNRFTETLEFGATAWRRRFARTGWRVIRCSPVKVFYSSNHILAAAVGLRTRTFLTSILGSASIAYLVSPPQGDAHTGGPT